MATLVNPVAPQLTPIDPLASRIYRFNVDQFHQMIEQGILTKYDRVELIEGVLVPMTPIGSRHSASVSVLAELFRERLGKRVWITVQGPLTLADGSEVYPDVLLLARRQDFYSGKNPTPEAAYLVVEVSDSTLAHDRDVKSVLYAQANVQEYWIVDLTSPRIHVHRNPVNGVWSERLTAKHGDTVAPQAFSDIDVNVADVTF